MPLLRRQELRRLHLYSRQPFEVGALVEGLQQLPLQHVSLLGEGWGNNDIMALLNALPNTVTSVYIGNLRAALRLGKDDNGQVSCSDGCVATVGV